MPASVPGCHTTSTASARSRTVGEVERAAGVDDRDEGLAERRDGPQHVELAGRQPDVGDRLRLARARPVLAEQQHRRVVLTHLLERHVAEPPVARGLRRSPSRSLRAPAPGVTTSSPRPSRLHVPSSASPSSTNGSDEQHRALGRVERQHTVVRHEHVRRRAARSATSRVAGVGAFVAPGRAAYGRSKSPRRSLSRSTRRTASSTRASVHLARRDEVRRGARGRRRCTCRGRRRPGSPGRGRPRRSAATPWKTSWPTPFQSATTTPSKPHSPLRTLAQQVPVGVHRDAVDVVEGRHDRRARRRRPRRGRAAGAGCAGCSPRR